MVFLLEETLRRGGTRGHGQMDGESDSPETAAERGLRILPLEGRRLGGEEQLEAGTNAKISRKRRCACI